MVITTLEREVGRDYEWPGNVRELEQAVRSILLTLHYNKNAGGTGGYTNELYRAVERESVNAQDLVAIYCSILYRKYGTYGKVAKITNLDPRTVKKHLQNLLLR